MAIQPKIDIFFQITGPYEYFRQENLSYNKHKKAQSCVPTNKVIGREGELQSNLVIHHIIHCSLMIQNHAETYIQITKKMTYILE